MDLTGQIITQKVGSTQKKNYGVSDLKSVITENADKKKHVILYPGDYGEEWSEGEKINIPSKTSITVMPGAIMQYVEDYRIKDFKVDDGEGGEKTYDGKPIASTQHPLYRTGNAGDDFTPRYDKPNFTGHIENITDLNLASEWAFKQEFERSIWSVKGNSPGGDSTNLLNVPFRGVVEYKGGNKINVAAENLQGEDKGAAVTISHIDYNDTDDNFENNGETEVLQTINVRDGHVLSATTLDFKEDFGSKDGYINFTESANGNLQINHTETGFSGGNGESVPAPTIPDTKEDSNLVPGEEYSVGLRTFETDDRGHVNGIEYAPTVEDVSGGVGINVGETQVGIKNVEIDTDGFTTGDNVLIQDSLISVSVSLTDQINKSFTGEPPDPELGEAVTWVSESEQGIGDTGDFMIKVNVRGTTKYGTLFDYDKGSDTKNIDQTA